MCCTFHKNSKVFANISKIWHATTCMTCEDTNVHAKVCVCYRCITNCSPHIIGSSCTGNTLLKYAHRCWRVTEGVQIDFDTCKGRYSNLYSSIRRITLCTYIMQGHRIQNMTWLKSCSTYFGACAIPQYPFTSIQWCADCCFHQTERGLCCKILGTPCVRLLLELEVCTHISLI